MACKDKSQGHAFVFSNGPEIKFSTLEDKPTKSSKFKEIQEHLDRLQKLHHELHGVLEELANLEKKKK